MAKKKKIDDASQIRMTDRGAIHALMQVINSLLLISSVIASSQERVTTVKQLTVELKAQLRKILQWMNRVPDGTLYDFISKEEIELIKKDAEIILKQKVVPNKKEYEKHQNLLKKFESLQGTKEKRAEKRLTVMPDTSLLLTYSLKNANNFESVKVLATYLKTQNKYFDLYLSNFVLLEFISKLKQQYPIGIARQEFENTIREINGNSIAISPENLTFLNIFERYQKFAKRQISSGLKSNDFIIATDGILADAIILTCDKKMYELTQKSYKNIFLINKDASSYIKFIKAFEKEKQTLLC